MSDMKFTKANWAYICDIGDRVNKIEKKIEDMKSIFKGLKDTIERRL